MAKNKKGTFGSGSKKVNVVVVALFLVVILGLILRLVGINHGFPFIFHPDEPTIIRSALGIRFDPNPKHFDWPHLYIYLNYFLYMFIAKLRDITVSVGLKNTVSDIFPLLWNDELIYYYLTRCFSAILGALTAIPVFLAGKTLFGKRAGLFAALAISIMPYHVWHSHYSLSDVPMVFFMSWAFYFSCLIIKNLKLKFYILSGLFIGLSASTKYNGGLSAFMVPVAHFLRYIEMKLKGSKNAKKALGSFLESRGILYLVVSGLSALVGFLIGTPYALMDFDTFSRNDGPQGAFWQFKNVGSVGIWEHFTKFFTESFGRILADTGYIVIPVFFLGMFYLIYKMMLKKLNKEEVFLIFPYIMSLFLVWYLSGFENNRSHYYFVVYPFLAVIFGFFTAFYQGRVSWVLNSGFLKIKSNLARLVTSFILAGLLFTPLMSKSIINSYRYYRGDTRNQLFDWLSKNYQLPEKIIYNDKALGDVIKKVNKSGLRGLYNFSKSESSTIVIYSPGLDDYDFIKENGTNFEEVVRFDSDLRLGSDIEVYRYAVPVNSCGSRK